ncbi:MAG: hypothetical protein P8X82_11080, partial [Gemmatimonadales bacterium]
MKWIEAVITYLFPSVLLEGKPWRHMGEEKERELFTIICRYFFFFAGIVYLGHYFFYDKVMGLEPLERWFAFRMVVTGAAFAAFLFYLTPLSEARLHKLPAILALWIFCYTQAMIVTWWDGTPWLYSFVFVVASIIIIRATPILSVVIATLFMTTQAPFLLEAG